MDSVDGGDGWLGPLQWLLANGGVVVAILLVMSVVALAVILLKLWQFWQLRIGNWRPLDRAEAHWRARRRDEALAELAASRHPAAEVLAVALRGRARGVDGATLREEIQRLAAERLEVLRGQLRVLEVIGALSPLLGLLGTVIGMIRAFQELEAAGSQVDPALLSGGIWEALLTTAAGLAVAIPVVAILSLLERTVERVGHGTEDRVTRVFTDELRADLDQRDSDGDAT